jgi:uncharacterized protein (UPF0335 family)
MGRNTLTAPIPNTTHQMIAFIERVETLNAELKAIQADRKEVFAEASAAGWNVKALKRVIRERAMDREELDEFEALVKMYWGALGR